MITRVLMPKLSEAMEQGKVVKWLKREGEPVKGGDVIAEIETDKANVEIEAFGSGLLRKIIVPEGGQVPVGQVIGVIADPADDIGGVAADLPKAPAAAPPAEAPTRALPVEGAYKSAPETMAVVSMGAEISHVGGGGQAVAAPPSGGRVKASPLAKKIAAQSGVDLRGLQGTGPGGRIVRRDVETALPAAPAPVAPVAPVAPAAPAAPPAAARPAFSVPSRPGVEFEDIPLTSMRAAIARR